MKVKLLQDLQDSLTNKMLSKDSVIEVSDERGKKAIENKLAVEVVEKKATKTEVIEEATKPVKEVKKAVRKSTKK